MSIENVLTSESNLAVIAAALGALWTLFKSSEWYSRVRTRRFRRAVLAVEAAVELTYQSYVRAIKQSRQDGRLTDEERREARRIARETALRFGQTHGIDIARELGREYLDLWIAKLVKRLKR
ncbi:MAG: hypothetical protein HY706_04100 [Candidatus Hydrogenedentes bacterium]|nr:hypothetical protein [Candidatus Hydrogenedentota bacterium]